MKLTKRKVAQLWDALKPLERSKQFRMKPTCLFVFHTWKELDSKQKEIVLNAVRIIIENEIVAQEVNKFISELRVQLAKSVSRYYGGGGRA